MPYTPIAGTLGYILSPDRRRVLLVRRTARADDDQFGKYNGLGGKMRPDEDVATCMIREIREEAGIAVTEMSLRGTVNWTNFGPKGEDWLGFVFLITGYAGKPVPASPEGPLSWIELGELEKLPMWEGDRHFLPLVFDGNPRPFHGFLPYDRDKPLGWTCVRL
ncbi:MAG: 8-oxo-dGTP diphosphatase [Planctomycetota bacterium]|jgi:8-oxo-dGTP diphosphatase|nr:8-oxo-dGTP diphosphatase [Planctomycetota bacterium]